MKQALHLILLILAAYSLSEARAGTVGGGGGTVVQSPQSPHFVLWDLYVRSPNLSDASPGDRIQVSDANYRRLAKWTDYRDFKSYRLVKSRVHLWQARLPNLFRIINALGFAENNPPFPDLLFISTGSHINQIDEIEVPPELEGKNLKLYPVGFFSTDYFQLLVDAEIWNGTGLLSQAGTLLHERLREIQQTFVLSNQDLQEIVATVILTDPSSGQDVSRLDDLFLPSKDMSATALSDPKEHQEALTSMRRSMQARIQCAKTSSPASCMRSFGKDYVGEVGNSFGDPLNAKWEYDLNVALDFGPGVLINNLVSFSAHSAGVKNVMRDDGGEIIAQTLTCPKVLAEHGLTASDSKFSNYCGNDGLSIQTGLRFPMPPDRELTVEITGSGLEGMTVSAFATANDDGVAMGILESAENDGQYVTVYGPTIARQKVGFYAPFDDHTYIFRFSPKERKLDITLIGDGNGNRIVLGSWPFAISRKNDGLYWTVKGSWFERIKKIEILRSR